MSHISQVVQTRKVSTIRWSHCSRPAIYSRSQYPFAPRALAFPAAAVELVTLRHAVAALGTGVGIPGHIGGDVPDRLRRAITDLADDVVPQGPDKRLDGRSQAEGAGHETALHHLAGIEDVVRIHLGFECLQALQPLFAEDLAGLTGEVKPRGIRPSPVFFRDFHDGQRQGKDEVVPELPLVAGDEAEYDHLGIAPGAFPNDQPLLDDGLADLAFHFGHHIPKRRERNDHLGGHEARAKPFDNHHLETVVPLVVSDLVREELRLTGLEQVREDVVDTLAVFLPKSKSHDVGRREEDPLPDGVTGVHPQRSAVFHFRHARVDEAEGPDRQSLLDDPLHQALQVIRIGATDRDHAQPFLGHDLDGHLTDKPSGAFGLGHEIEVRSREFPYRAVGQHPPGTDHVVTEPS